MPMSKHVRTLYFVGLGLRAEHLTEQGRRALSESKTVFVEGYTSFYYPNLREFFDNIIHVKRSIFVNRKMLEEESGKIIWKSLGEGDSTLAVIGDPFIATTHNYLRTEARKKGYRTVYVPGINIFSYSVGITGLFNYKFGESATIVEPWGEILSTRPYEVLVENRRRDLHTFFYLDISGAGRPMNASRAIELLLEMEERERKGALREKDMVIIIQHASWPDERIYYTSVDKALSMRGLSPPHSLIFPGKLHFMEEDVLEAYRV